MYYIQFVHSSVLYQLVLSLLFLNFAAKVVHFFELCKKRGVFFAILALVRLLISNVQ